MKTIVIRISEEEFLRDDTASIVIEVNARTGAAIVVKEGKDDGEVKDEAVSKEAPASTGPTFFKFNTKNKVTLADKGKIMLANGINDKKEYDPKAVWAVSGETNTFAITFPYVKSNIYNLIIDKGAFKVDFLGRDEDVQRIEVKGIFAVNDSDKDGEPDEVLKGDVNGDEAVDVADISVVIVVMAGNGSGSLVTAADVNGDGTVDVADMSAVIVIMAQQ